MSYPSHRLEVQHLTRVFGGRPVVDDLSLTVAAGQVTCLLGPSGCGKSTTLRMIAGVEQPDQGRVLIDGAVVSDEIRFLPPEARSVGLMFQDFALFPHLTLLENVTFGLRGLDRASARARGFIPAGLARTMAALVARSPCEGSRGGSTATAARLSPPGRVPAASSASSAIPIWRPKAA